MTLDEFVVDFATGMGAADAKRAQARSPRTGRIYQPGIGFHPEDQAVDLTVAELRQMKPDVYANVQTRVLYPGSRQRCDLPLHDWAIEVKMARPNGDNGKPDDTSIKDILSPYETDRSALADATKLAVTTLARQKAILIYGFEDRRRPLEALIEAFEILARTRVTLGVRFRASWAL